MSNFSCSGCEKTWGGALTSHCGGCHRTFSGLSTFDKHRVGPHAKGRSCLDPETAVEENADSPKFGERLFRSSGRAYPCYGLAGDSTEWWKES